MISPSFAGHFLWTQLHAVPLPPPDAFAGQTILVTGANSGLGLEAARHAARLGAAHVILACRSAERGEAAAASIRASVAGRAGKNRACAVDVWTVDLASFASVAIFARRALTQLDRLDAVIENAGVAIPRYSRAVDGHEATITVNVLSTALLALLLLPLLRSTAARFNVQPRLSIVTSDAHVFARFREAKEPSIFAALRDPSTWSHDRYNTSKLIEIYLVRQLAHFLDAHRIPVTVNCIAPGFCHTNLFLTLPQPFRSFARLGLLLIGRSAEMGARTLIAAATAGPASNGQYMDSGKIWPPGSNVTSPTAAAVQQRVFEQLLDVLEEVHPGISANLE